MLASGKNDQSDDIKTAIFLHTALDQMPWKFQHPNIFSWGWL